MGEVLFYHLTRSPLEATLAELLEKSRARGWRALVRARDGDTITRLDARLWSVGGDASFLAHGCAGGAHDEAQPVLLCAENAAQGQNVNRADILFAVAGARVDPGEVPAFTRVCILFDGNDEAALGQARAEWKGLTDAGLAAKYWSQESGSWVQMATKNC